MKRSISISSNKWPEFTLHSQPVVASSLGPTVNGTQCGRGITQWLLLEAALVAAAIAPLVVALEALLRLRLRLPLPLLVGHHAEGGRLRPT
jgi:hypothetical protein